MSTEQTLRRRRGRAIRNARRQHRNGQLAPVTVEQVLFLFNDGLGRAVDALVEALTTVGMTASVAAHRMLPLLFTPRDGAGARRQLLHNGRAPRKGGR